MDFEIIAALISFAALVIVWAFAPTQKGSEVPAGAVAAQKAVA